MPPVVLENLDCLKEFVGREIGTSDWLTISHEKIQKFAEVTGDRQWIHVDPERAKRESPYGATVAHGFLTLSFLSELMNQTLRIRHGIRLRINYGLNRVRFTAPVLAGQNIRARFTLQSLSSVAEGWQAVFSVIIEPDKGAKPCCVAEWVVRYYT